MSKDLKADTLEQLRAMALAQALFPSRYTLETRFSQEWSDPVAGSRWEKKRAALKEKYIVKAKELAATGEHPGPMPLPYYKVPGFQEEADKLDGQQPRMRETTAWYLSEVGGHYLHAHPTIVLGDRLGSSISGVWTKKKTRWRESLVGALTLKGILVRLGAAKGLEEEIAAVRKVQAERDAKRSRNSARRSLRGAVHAMEQALVFAKEYGLLEKKADLEGLTLLQAKSLIGSDEPEE